MNSCPNCNYELKNRYIGSQNNPSKIKCPKCRKRLAVTAKSAIIYMVVTMVPVIILALFVKNVPIKVITVVVWMLLSLRLIRPVMYRYEVERG